MWLQEARTLRGLDDREALKTYDLALAAVPGVHALEQEREACRGRVEAIQRLEDQVNAYLAEASSALSARRWGSAVAACAAGLALAGRHDELERLARQATDEQKKEQEARRLERLAAQASFAAAIEAEQPADAERILARLEVLGIARDELHLRRRAVDDVRAALERREQVAAGCHGCRRTGQASCRRRTA